jgi:hypothetical protein
MFKYFFTENCVVYEIMCENVEYRDPEYMVI